MFSPPPSDSFVPSAFTGVPTWDNPPGARNSGGSPTYSPPFPITITALGNSIGTLKAQYRKDAFAGWTDVPALPATIYTSSFWTSPSTIEVRLRWASRTNPARVSTETIYSWTFSP